ncbi:MAG: TIGR03862 family flavoprotein [Ignavibacteriae bacterium]|nr:TIGR03862 family flavoprotein [Ignavibacteriota bacterium]
MSRQNKQIAILGGGASGLMAAYILSKYFDVTIYEKEKNIGQKLLVAGKGGFNLTSDLPIEELIDKYFPKHFLSNAISKFNSTDLRNWLAEIGIPTYVGTSGRVFPQQDIKPIEVLDKIKRKLLSRNVKILENHKFISLDEKKRPIVEYKSEEKLIKAEYYIFSLGGASWKITGSDGTWKNKFNAIGVKTIPFKASNCGINIKWSDNVKLSHSGKPLKNIRISIGNLISNGEAVITDYGLEGNAIYSIVPGLRNPLSKNKTTEIFIDFKPSNSLIQLQNRTKNISTIAKSIRSKDYAKIFNLNSTELSIIKSYTDKETYLEIGSFVKSIKNLAIPVESLRPIDEAISTVGGIDINELNSDFSLKKYPNIFTVGEMVDWDAPTGGFLLQGCFSMGHFAGRSILGRQL